MDLRLACEEIDDAVDHGEERHERQQRQVGERRRAQRDGFAAEPVCHQQHGADEVAGARMRAESRPALVHGLAPPALDA